VALVTRVRALWLRSRLVVGITWSIFALNISSYIISFGYMYGTATMVPAASPFTGCQFMPTFGPWYIPLITCIVLETCFIVLTVIKTYPQVRQQVGGSNNWLSPLLLTDGLIYYLTIITVQISTLILTYVADTSVSFPILASFPALTVVAISCNRLFIRLQSNLSNKTDRILGDNTLAGMTTEMNCDEVVTFGQGGRRRVHSPLSTGFSSIALGEVGGQDIKKDPKGDASV
jgi:hypothetical protein